MRKLLLLFAFVIFFQQSYAQCFATPGSQWVFSGTHAVTDHSGTIVYTYERDSVIDNLPVKVLSNKFTMYLHMWGQGGDYFLSGDNVVNDNPGYDYIYSDSNVVKYYKDGEFYTLADFTMQPGDSFLVAYNSPYNRDLSYTTYTHVDSVGTVNINGENLRYLVYSTPAHDGIDVVFEGRFVEKIGFYTGQYWQFMFPSFFIYDLSDVADWEPYVNEWPGELRCFSDSSQFIYHNQFDEDDCIFLVGTEEQEFEKIKVYPNPGNDFIHINSPVNILGLQVINSIGQLCFSSNYNNTNDIRVDVSTLPTGIYSVLIQLQNNKAYTKRIVIE